MLSQKLMPFDSITVTSLIPRLERKRKPGMSGKQARTPSGGTPLSQRQRGGTPWPVSPGQSPPKGYQQNRRPDMPVPPGDIAA